MKRNQKWIGRERLKVTFTVKTWKHSPLEMKNISSAVMNVRDLNSKSFTIIKRWGQVKKVAIDFLETCMGHKGDRQVPKVT